MKRVLKILSLAIALSALLLSASATDTFDDSKFLMIDRSIDNTPVGEWVSVSEPNPDDNSTYSARDAGASSQTVYVISPNVAYNSIDLSTYTTEDLVVLLLNNHRSMASMLHFSRTNDPYEEAKAYYYGLSELENRADAAKVLVRALSALKSATPSTDQESTVFGMRIRFLTMVLNSQFYKTQLTEEDRITATATSAAAPLSETSAPALKSVYGFYYDYATSMTTRSGLSLYLYSARTDHSAAEKVIIRNELCEAHQGAILLGEATSAYNGYSYALYQQSTSNPYCLFDISDYLSDPHTSEEAVGIWDNCDTGDLIVYYDENGDPVHAAIIENTNEYGVRAISKWDDMCLFRHEVNDVPNRFYVNSDIGDLTVRMFVTTAHAYSITSYNSSTHTYSCDICNKTRSEAHISDGLGGCRYCDFQGIGIITPIVPG